MECQLNWLRKQPRDSTSNRLIDADGIYPAVYVALLNWFGSIINVFLFLRSHTYSYGFMRTARLQQQEEAARAVAAPHSTAEPEQIAPECCEAKLLQGTRELGKAAFRISHSRWTYTSHRN